MIAVQPIDWKEEARLVVEQIEKRNKVLALLKSKGRLNWGQIRIEWNVSLPGQAGYVEPIEIVETAP